MSEDNSSFCTSLHSSTQGGDEAMAGFRRELSEQWAGFAAEVEALLSEQRRRHEDLIARHIGAAPAPAEGPDDAKATPRGERAPPKHSPSLPSLLSLPSASSAGTRAARAADESLPVTCASEASLADLCTMVGRIERALSLDRAREWRDRRPRWSLRSSRSSCASTPPPNDKSRKEYRATMMMTASRTFVSRQTFARRWLSVRFQDWFQRWDWAEPPEPEGRLAAFVFSKYFEGACVAVIMSNSLFSGYTVNYEIEHPAMASPMLHGLDLAFAGFYTFELLLKMLAQGRYFFLSRRDLGWNIFDVFLVVFTLADLVVSEVGRDSGGMSIAFMRVLRIMRVAKLLRGLRVIRFVTDLRLMLNSLGGSLVKFGWSVLLLALVFYIFALIFVQGVALYLQSEGELVPDHTRAAVLRKFGSVQLATLTLYEAVSGGSDWHSMYDVAMTIGVAYGIMFVLFIAFCQIALLNILTAIFVNHALELAKPDKDAMAADRCRQQVEAYEELCALCHDMDLGETGGITASEFESQMTGGRLGARLSMLGLDIRDAQAFFQLLLVSSTTEPQRVSAEDFVEGCMRMRGAASGIDIHGVERQARLLSDALAKFRAETRSHIARLAASVAGGAAASPHAHGLRTLDGDTQRMSI